MANPKLIFFFFLSFSIILTGCNNYTYIIDNSNNGVNMSYAEVYYHNETDALTLSISDVGVYTQLTGFNVGDNKGISVDNTSFTLDRNSTYSLDSSFSFTGGANSNYHCAVFLNNVELEDCEFQRTMGNTATIGVSTITCLIQGIIDAELTIRCQDADAPAQDFMLYAFNTNIIEVS